MTDKKMGVYCEGGLIEEIITLEDAFDYIENICGSDYKIIYKKFLIIYNLSPLDNPSK